MNFQKVLLAAVPLIVAFVESALNVAMCSKRKENQCNLHVFVVEVLISLSSLELALDSRVCSRLVVGVQRSVYVFVI